MSRREVPGRHDKYLTAMGRVSFILYNMYRVDYPELCRRRECFYFYTEFIEGVIDDESFDFIEQPAQKRIKTLKYLNSTSMGIYPSFYPMDI